jgi:predicted DNA-binding transcriptional regulator YafY
MQLSAIAISAGEGLVGRYHPAGHEVDPSSLPPEIQEALLAKTMLAISYIDATGSETERTITPLRVEGSQEAIYLVAYCHLREEERHFRLDRILFIRKTE